MGDPRKSKKKYATPRHPWEAERIKDEAVLVEEFGLKNKKELMKMNTYITKLKNQAKKLTRTKTVQAEKETKLLLEKVVKMNLLPPTAKLDDILELSIREVLERRLQTQIVRKGLAKSMKQARQFIVHGHVMINDTKVNVPSYLLKKGEEFKISFLSSSPFIRADHPELMAKKETKKEKKIVREVEEELPTLLTEEEVNAKTLKEKESKEE